MRRLSRAVMLMLALFLIIPLEAGAVQLLIPGGQLIGLELQNDAVTVAAFDDTFGAAARDAGLQIGDQLLTVEGRPVTSAEDVRQALKTCGQTVNLEILRGSKRLEIAIAPVDTREGRRLGVYLRQGIAGVGTVTFYDPESDVFGTLGHGVNDNQGTLLAMTTGKACPASVASVKKGKSGDPGQLRGNADPEILFGTITKNTPQGVHRRAAAHRILCGCQTRPRHHPLHRGKRRCSGIFCGNSQNLSGRPDRLPEFPHPDH